MRADTRFEDGAIAWASHTSLSELAATPALDDGDKRSRFLHSIQLHAARKALQLAPAGGVVLDFGCGTGRFLRYFGQHGYRMIGTDIASDALDQARQLGVPSDCRLLMTDGVHLPLEDESVDMVWISNMLQACGGESAWWLEIAHELHRVLKSGCTVVNLAVGAEQAPSEFNRNFERAGFMTRDVRVLHRYGRWDQFFEAPWMPRWGTAVGGRMYAAVRYQLDVAHSSAAGSSDYLFFWEKLTKPVTRTVFPIDRHPIGAGQC